jgi:hypothetical protein
MDFGAIFAGKSSRIGLWNGAMEQAAEMHYAAANHPESSLALALNRRHQKQITIVPYVTTP